MQDAYQTHRRQLYILPTKTGWMLGAIIFALLIASIKYSHQGMFLLTFLLASIGQASSLYTHKNLLRITLSAVSAKPVFTDETAEFSITVKNPNDSKKHSVWLLCDNHSEYFSLEAQQSKTIITKVQTKHRGILPIPDIILTSHYPIGILFSWTKAFSAQADCTVYPKAKDFLKQPDLVSNDTEDEANSQSQKIGSDEFSTLKPYQTSDRLRDIHWPSLAKNQQLISKQFTAATTSTKVFNWDQVASLNIEDKLSQLTYWIIEAEKQQQQYQLDIPGFTSSLDLGSAHQHQCLSILANWPIASATS